MVEIRKKNYELTRLQTTILCDAMADKANNVERKLDRLKKKETFSIGFGETIPAETERERTFKELKVCLDVMKILSC
jgi:hypothetical protein